MRAARRYFSILSVNRNVQTARFRYFQSNKFHRKRIQTCVFQLHIRDLEKRRARSLYHASATAIGALNSAPCSTRSAYSASTNWLFFFPFPRDVPDCWKCKINGSAAIPSDLNPAHPFCRDTRARARARTRWNGDFSLCSRNSFRRKLNFPAFPLRAVTPPSTSRPS